MRNLVVVFVCVVVVLGTAAEAHAQSTRRPDLNLFGRGLRDPEQSLAVRGNLGVTFYDTITRPEWMGAGPEPPDRGWGSFGSAALVYNLRLANVTFDGTIGSFASYYPAQARPFRWKALPGAGARTAWSWALSEKTQMNVGLDLRYRPLYAESIFPGGGIGTGGGAFGGSFATGSDPNEAFLPRDAAFVDGSYLSFGPSASVRHTLSRRWSVSAGYFYQRDNAFDVDPDSSFRGSGWRQSARTALHFAVSRNLSVRGGYRYEESYFEGQDEPYRIHGADIGVDYGRGLVLQLARRTTLAMTGGASGYVDRGGRQRYRVTGDLQLTHEFQRTWASGASYSRGIGSDDLIFREPILTDRFQAYVDGLLTRRVGARATAEVQGGALAFGDPDTTSLRSRATAGLQTALGRHFALGVNYTYYYYRFDSAITLPSGLPAKSASQGVYVYLSAWAPIFQRGGRSNVAR